MPLLRLLKLFQKTTNSLARLFVLFLILGGVGFYEEALASPPAKNVPIIAIGGAVTETIYALGAGDQLIGRDTTSIYPAAATQLPDIGYMRTLPAEGILSLAPKAVLAIEGSGPPSTITMVKQAGIPIIDVPEAYDQEGVIRKINIIAQALGKENEAQALTKAINEGFKANEALVANITKPKRVLFLLSVQNGRAIAAGRGTPPDALIKLAGAVNVVDQFQGFKPINDEALVTAAPDAILFMGNGGLPITSNDILAMPSLAYSPAAKNHALLKIDAMYFLGFGPRSAQAVHELITMLYGTELSKER